MTTAFDYHDAPYAIRDDIPAAYQRFWTRLAGPGAWWTGAERVAIAAETRAATRCEFCHARAAALTPYQFVGEHAAATTKLSAAAVDAVHRIVTDQTRITSAWITGLSEEGISAEAYVELAGIVVAVFSIDEFNRALGLDVEPLPEPVAGEPSGYRPAQATTGTGFVPMLPRDGATGDEADLWPNGGGANVLRAFSVVPDAVRDWTDISSAQYLSMAGMANMVQDENRVINRMQMELIAGRVSAINQCFY